jgi:hypothetical protein
VKAICSAFPEPGFIFPSFSSNIFMGNFCIGCDAYFSKCWTLKSNWSQIDLTQLCKSLLYLGKWFEDFSAEYVVMPIWVCGMNFWIVTWEQLSKHDQVIHYLFCNISINFYF